MHPVNISPFARATTPLYLSECGARDNTSLRMQGRLPPVTKAMAAARMRRTLTEYNLLRPGVH